MLAMHFTGGPAVAGADTGYVELQPGAQFPLHEHVGEEITLVLAGTIRDPDGTTHGPGEEIVKGPGSRHVFIAAPAALALLLGASVNAGPSMTLYYTRDGAYEAALSLA